MWQLRHSTTYLLITRWITSIEYPCAASRFCVLFFDGEQIAFDPFADRVIEKVGWTWQKQEPDSTRRFLRS